MNVDIESPQEQTVIHTYIKRVKEGVRIDVQVAPEVEDFFRHWGTGERVNVALHGKTWKPYPAIKPVPGLTAPTIEAWVIGDITRNVDAGVFDIYSLGRNIGMSSERGFNISFLRIVGASNPQGISFLVEDVVSLDGLVNMAERIRNATGRFYEQFIKPANLSIAVNTEVRMNRD